MSPARLLHRALAEPDGLRDDGGRDAVRSLQLVAVGLLGAAFWGAIVGTREGAAAPSSPELFCATRAPLVVVLPLVVLLPTLRWLQASAGASWAGLTREAALAVARIGLVLVATVPAVWIAWNAGLDPWEHTGVALAALFGSVIAGLRGVRLAGPGRGAGLLVHALVLVVVGQTTWVLLR